jgi:hypothetical protein
MSDVGTTIESLEAQAALASRLLRTKPVLQIYLRWLATPHSRKLPPQSSSKAVLKSINLLLEPLRNESDRAIQQETQVAGQWITSICEFIAGRQHLENQDYLIQSLACCLLPLYRSLATGRLQEGLNQTRNRLAETLVLVGLTEVLQLKLLLQLHVNPANSPGQVLRDHLSLDLCTVYHLITQLLPGYNQAQDQFDQAGKKLLRDFRAHQKLPASFQTPDWASQQTLWGLSNEISADRSELILPRTWIDIPVPWRNIASHWSELERLLRAMQPVAADVPPPTTNPSTQIAAAPDDDGPKAEYQKALDRSAAIVKGTQGGLDSFSAMDVIDHALTEEFNLAADAPTGQANATTANQAASKSDSSVVPRIIIGEISNHNDAALANVVRRQVALCKQEDRSISLSMIIVNAEDKEDQSLSALQENGLSRWQQKLVNWMCDHPELKQPVAFITRDGQLVLVVMDTERNAMTRVLRQGLGEVLSGKRDLQQEDLVNVVIPARYHVGISSTTGPGASFEFSELIASAHRCLSAAQRMGSASIKSIEVF